MSTKKSFTGKLPDGMKLPDNIQENLEVFAALQTEVLQNAELMVYMMNNVSDDMDMPERLGVIAAWMNLPLDGVYYPHILADLIVQELRKRNTLRTSTVAGAVRDQLFKH